MEEFNNVSKLGPIRIAIFPRLPPGCQFSEYLVNLGCIDISSCALIGSILQNLSYASSNSLDPELAFACKKLFRRDFSENLKISISGAGWDDEIVDDVVISEGIQMNSATTNNWLGELIQLALTTGLDNHNVEQFFTTRSYQVSDVQIVIKIINMIKGNFAEVEYPFDFGFVPMPFDSHYENIFSTSIGKIVKDLLICMINYGLTSHTSDTTRYLTTHQYLPVESIEANDICDADMTFIYMYMKLSHPKFTEDYRFWNAGTNCHAGADVRLVNSYDMIITQHNMRNKDKQYVMDMILANRPGFR